MDSRERYEVRCPHADALSDPPAAAPMAAGLSASAGSCWPDGCCARNGLGRGVGRRNRCTAAEEMSQLALPPGVVAEQIASLLALAGGPRRRIDASRPDQLNDRLHQALRDRYHEIGLTPADDRPASLASRPAICTTFLPNSPPLSAGSWCGCGWSVPATC